MRAVSIIALFFAVTAGCSSSSSSPAGDGGSATKHDIGGACPNGAGDCLPGLLCAGEDPGGGQCYKTCKPSTDSDCGDTTKFACSSEGHCYLRCNATTDCPRASEGYVCKDDTPARPPVKFCDTP